MIVCSTLPCSSSQVTNSISIWLASRQARLPQFGRRLTRLSTPRWPCSRIATMAPRKVSQTNSQRDTSSDTVIPELKA